MAKSCGLAFEFLRATPNYSVTRWLHYFSKFGHLHQRKFAQWHTKFAKVGPKICQIVNKPSKIAQDFKVFAKVAKFRQIWSHCPQTTFQTAADHAKIYLFNLSAKASYVSCFRFAKEEGREMRKFLTDATFQVN